VGQFGKALYLISDPLMTAAYPRFVSLVSSGRTKEALRLCLKSSSALFALFIPLLLLFAVFDRQLIMAFAGEKYVFFSYLLPWFVISFAPGIILFWTHPLILSLGIPQLSSTCNVVGRLVGQLLFAWLVFAHGLIGAALGSGIAACLTVLLSVGMIWRHLRKNHDSLQSTEVSPGSLTSILNIKKENT
jgi:O-antigen/teichoic acid export membrane protein